MTTSRIAFLGCSLGVFLLAMGACAPTSGNATGDGDVSSGAGTGTGDEDIDLGDGDGDIDPNQPAPPGCGNGIRTDDEACDDGNKVSDDGCAGNCLRVEHGYICREAGKACDPYAKCGDGIRSFPEQCDDGELLANDGCSPTCKTEIGWKCDGSPSSCSVTVCGDGIIEGAELCDDKNKLPFDGCSITCQLEPTCTVGGGCTSACGDGIVLGDEQCDDANSIDGDGCSSACKSEDGYLCRGEPCEEVNGECVLRVPAIFRDFPDSHPDMQKKKYGNAKGMVAATLDAEGKPVPAMPGNVTGLADWYRDNQGGNTGPILGEIVLFKTGERFVNRLLDDGTRWEAPVGSPSCQANVNNNMPCPVDGNPGFFPLDDIENPADTERHEAEAPQEFYGGYGVTGEFPGTHNFSFTTEVTYWFVYNPALEAQLTFVGDDDVWVFINGQLAVDIGNLHVPTGGRIRLGATEATVGYGTDLAETSWTESTRPISDFNLTAGNAYEIKVFHAERQVLASSFQLTLAGFDTSRSDCQPNCGDGIIGVGEECDDGMNDGGYNECQTGCVLGGYCGDGIVQAGETCDDNDPGAPANCQGCQIIVVK